MKRRNVCGLIALGASGFYTPLASAGRTCPPKLEGESTSSVVQRCGDGERLSDIAAELSAGEFSNMPVFAQNPLTKHNPEISWQTICWFDDRRDELQYMGAPQASFSTDHQHYIFSAETNTWRTTGQELFPSIGHVWSTAFDPETGDYYFKRMSGDEHLWQMQREVENGRGAASDPWKRTSGHPELADSPLQKVGMAWHPNLFGAGDSGIALFSDDRVMGWRKSNDSWHVLWEFPPKAEYSEQANGSGVYIPAADAVLIGSGVNSKQLLRVHAGSNGRGGNVEVVAKAPVPVTGRVSSNTGKMLNHPTVAGRTLILENEGTRVWISDDAGSSWQQASFRHPFDGSMPGMNNGFVACTIRKYGVIAGLTSRTRDEVSPTFRLWRPA